MVWQFLWSRVQPNIKAKGSWVGGVGHWGWEPHPHQKARQPLCVLSLHFVCSCILALCVLVYLYTCILVYLSCTAGNLVGFRAPYDANKLSLLRTLCAHCFRENEEAQVRALQFKHRVLHTVSQVSRSCTDAFTQLRCFGFGDSLHWGLFSDSVEKSNYFIVCRCLFRLPTTQFFIRIDIDL